MGRRPPTARAAASGLEFGLYRDLAVGCAYEGGEVWARPDLFAASVSIGAPPDPFSATGQIWNLPPFIPHALAREGFAPYTDILRANMRHAGVLRIDHVLGLARQFWIPRGESGADGAYVRFPLDHLIAATAAESQRAKCMVIGEDLGTVPEGLRAKLAAANILSYRVLWFEQDEQRFHPPSTYPRLSTACLSSHDLAPFKGWEASAPAGGPVEAGAGRERRRTLEWGPAWPAPMPSSRQSPSAVMLVQADDLTGETEPLNVPGTDEERPNWRRRLSVDVNDIPALVAAKSVIAAVKRRGHERTLFRPRAQGRVARLVLVEGQEAHHLLHPPRRPRGNAAPRGNRPRPRRRRARHRSGAAAPCSWSSRCASPPGSRAIPSRCSKPAPAFSTVTVRKSAPAARARRNSATGLRNFRPVATCFASPGAVTERMLLFLADYNPDDRIGDGGGVPHEGEDIEVIEMEFDEAYAMIASGGIADAKTVILLQAAKLEG